MRADEILNIDTPENVSFDYEIAGIASRFAAALIDTILILILQVVANLLVILIVLRLTGSQGFDFDALSGWIIALMGLVAFLFLWGYYIFFEMLWNGQTPGKRLVRLRVIRADGKPITLAESVIRNLVRLVDFLPAYYGVGTVAIFLNRQTRRLGDLAAGTLVVREKNQHITLKDLASLPAASQPRPREEPPADALPFAYPVKLLSEQDIQVIEGFLQRRGQLANQTALASRLRARMLLKMSAQAEYDGTVSDEDALQHILSEYRRYHNRA